MPAWIVAAGLLAGAVAAAVGAAAAEGPAASRPAEKDPAAEPLPAGAVARFGWARLHHGGWIRGLAFSGDSRILASCGGQYNQTGDACLWDVTTGRLLRTLPGPVQGVGAISISPDGKTVLTAGLDQTVGFWNLATGKAAEGLTSGNARGHWATYAADGKTVAISNNSDLWIVNPEGGKLIHTIAKAAYCSFSADSRRIAVASMQDPKMGVELWDAASGTRLRAMEYESPQQQMQRFALPTISANGKLIAAGLQFGAERGVMLVWDADTGKVLKKLTGSGNFVNWVAMSADGKFLASTCRMGIVNVWDIPTGKQIKDLPVSVGGPEVLAFSPDGKLLAAGGQNGQIRIWTVPSFAELYAESGHRGTVRDVSASRDGRWVCTVGEDSTARLWDGPTGKQLLRLQDPGVKYITAAVSPDGSTLATGCSDDTVRIWDAPGGKLRRTVKVPAGAGVELAFLPQGDRLVAIGPSLAATTIDLASGVAHSTAGELKSPAYAQLALSGDLSVGAVFDRGAIQAWELKTGKSRGTFAIPGVPYSSASAIDFTGRLLAVDMGQKIVLVELDSGKLAGEITPQRRQGGQGKLAFSPDGSMLAVCDMDGTISLWSLPKGEKLDDRKGHRGPITALAFTGDGKRLLSGGNDGTAVLWRVDDLKKSELPDEAKAFAADPRKGWEELASTDAAKAQQAIWGLIAAGEPAVKVLQERLESVKGPSPEQIAKLIEELGHGQFAVRKRASDALGRLGPLAEIALRQAAASETVGEEVRARAQQLLDALDDPQQRSGEMVRQLRALFVLERIASPQSRDVLRKLAAGAPQATLTQRAAAALERLNPGNR